MNEEQVKLLLTDMLESFTVGSILHLLAEVLRAEHEEDEGLRDAVGALFIVGVGIDSVLPREG